MKYRFLYAPWPFATVTVRAEDEDAARRKAAAEMDRRYAKQGKEPPVAWTFTLLGKGEKA